MELSSGSPTGAGQEWLVLSARLQRLVAQRSGRTDVVVRIGLAQTVTPTWTGGYRHDIAEVLLDGPRYLDPEREAVDQLDPARADMRADHAALIGACCIAAAHAAHTRFDVPSSANEMLAHILVQLEGARVCAAYIHDHPADRVWIRAGLGTAPEGGVIGALRLLALAEASVITHREATTVRTSLVERLGNDVVDRVLAICRQAVSQPDGQSRTLIDLAAEAAAALGLRPDEMCQPSPLESADVGEHAEGVVQLQWEIAESAAQLARRRVHRKEAAPGAGYDEAAVRSYARAAERTTFGDSRGPAGVTLREPDEGLRRRARGLAAALRQARYRAPAVTSQPSGLPPGRITLAEVMRREGQLAARATLTAKPWRKQVRRAVAQPHLSVGLSWDTSASMRPHHSTMADLAWALSWAMSYSGGSVAAVAWSRDARAVVSPGEKPNLVRVPDCGGGSTGCPQSIRALDGALHFSDGLGAKVLIVATDLGIGHRPFVNDEIARLTALGVRTIWVTPAPDPRTPPGATNLVPRPDRSLSLNLGDVICSTLKETHA